MVKLTMIARVTDGLLLAEGMDDSRHLKDVEFYKQQVKALFKNLSRGHNEASRMSVETGPYIFQYPSHTCEGAVGATAHQATKRWERDCKGAASGFCEEMKKINLDKELSDDVVDKHILCEETSNSVGKSDLAITFAQILKDEE